MRLRHLLLYRASLAIVPVGPSLPLHSYYLAGGLFFAVPDAAIAHWIFRESERCVSRRIWHGGSFPLAHLKPRSFRDGSACGRPSAICALLTKVFGTALFAVVLSIIFAFLVRSTVWTFGKLEAERAAVLARLHDPGTAAKTR